MQLFTIIDILGTVAFAISGVLTAMNKKMDHFGIFIIATVTSVGGGTLRDILVGKTPVSWMLDMTFIYVIVLSTVFAVLFRSKLKYFRKSLFLFDTIGIALYTTTGAQIGLAADLHPLICIALGMISACFGGVLRDILCNEIPIIFRKEIYATACMVGGAIFLLLKHFTIDNTTAVIIAGLVIMGIRILAVIYKLQLPSIYKKKVA